MKKLLVILPLIVFLVVGLLMLFPFLAYIPVMVMAQLKIAGNLKAMQAPAVYEPVGRRLALYAQSDPALIPEHLGPHWIPKELSDLVGKSRGDGFVSKERAGFTFGGGFTHWGYVVMLDPDASRPGTNFWRLDVRSDSSSRELYTFELPANQQLSADELLGLLLPELDRSIAREPDELRNHFRKIRTLMDFGRIAEARQAARETLRTFPDDWHAVLLNAFLTAAEKSPAAGVAEVESWAKSGETFDRYTDLAWFNFSLSRPEAAAAALRRCTEIPPDLSGGEGYRASFRGFSLAFCAYRTGSYDVAAALCSQMIETDGDTFGTFLNWLKSASERALAGNPSALVWPTNEHVFSPFAQNDGYQLDIEKLTGLKLNIPSEANIRTWPLPNPSPVPSEAEAASTGGH